LGRINKSQDSMPGSDGIIVSGKVEVEVKVENKAEA
jgi:hypothetical protein